MADAARTPARRGDPAGSAGAGHAADHGAAQCQRLPDRRVGYRLPDARLWPHPPDGAGAARPGGFLGVYTDDWSDDTNRALFRDDTPTDAAAFHPYTHQSGLQGWLFGRVNRLLRHWLPDGLARETALYWLNSTLFYAAELLVALAVWEEFGPLAAAFGFASVLLAPGCSAA
ncbi:hypothetical protein NIA69_21875 [Gemmiger formicilis]|nr:hypothetical protein [Gemmiger formicilis]